MKLTVDRMCIQSGRLCANCSERYAKGEISDLDIKIGKVIMDTAKSTKYLSNISLLKIVPGEETVFVIVTKGDKEKFDRAEALLKPQFSKFDKRNVIILEKKKNVRQLIKELLGTKYIVATSTVFIPFSDKEIKVQVKKEGKDLVMKEKEISKITNVLLGMKTHFAFV